MFSFGVHIGHKKIISQLVKKSKELGLPSVLISFTPTAFSFFAKTKIITNQAIFHV
jgi:riboflavin kinase/FMN adenylyltransferase